MARTSKQELNLAEKEFNSQLQEFHQEIDRERSNPIIVVINAKGAYQPSSDEIREEMLLLVEEKAINPKLGE